MPILYECDKMRYDAIPNTAPTISCNHSEERAMEHRNESSSSSPPSSLLEHDQTHCEEWKPKSYGYASMVHHHQPVVPFSVGSTNTSIGNDDSTSVPDITTLLQRPNFNIQDFLEGVYDHEHDHHRDPSKHKHKNKSNININVENIYSSSCKKNYTHAYCYNDDDDDDVAKDVDDDDTSVGTIDFDNDDLSIGTIDFDNKNNYTYSEQPLPFDSRSSSIHIPMIVESTSKSLPLKKSNKRDASCVNFYVTTAAKTKRQCILTSASTIVLSFGNGNDSNSNYMHTSPSPIVSTLTLQLPSPTHHSSATSSNSPFFGKN
uniref:Uncharacterized protein n=1 Tax=Pseudo-nitzschia australis TaxID=44445 RepID=A0A7S4EH67_9STRA